MIVLRLPPGPAAAPAAYRVAGELLAADRPLAELEPWRAGGADGEAAVAEHTAAGEATARTTAAATADGGQHRAGAGRAGEESAGEEWAGEGWVGGVLRRVACREVAGGYLLAVEGAGRFLVAADGDTVTWAGREPPPGGDPARVAVPPEPSPGGDGPPREVPAGSPLAAAVLGPVLALALALRGTFCLHASACLFAGSSALPGPVAVARPARGGGVHAFLGESGAGKSTLARELPRLPGAGWWRVADDVLPVRLAAAGLVALPRFPQLKLAPGEQFAGAALAEQRPSLPVAALHLLAGRGVSLLGPSGAATAPSDGAAGDSLPAPVVVPLEGRAAALTVAAHTVAARLFPPALLARHLAFCFAVAERVPVARLAVPPLPDHAAAVAAALART